MKSDLRDNETRGKSVAGDGHLDDTVTDSWHTYKIDVSQKLKKRYSHSGWQATVLSYFFLNGL